MFDCRETDTHLKIMFPIHDFLIYHFSPPAAKAAKTSDGVETNSSGREEPKISGVLWTAHSDLGMQGRMDGLIKE